MLTFAPLESNLDGIERLQKHKGPFLISNRPALTKRSSDPKIAIFFIAEK